MGYTMKHVHVRRFTKLSLTHNIRAVVRAIYLKIATEKYLIKEQINKPAALSKNSVPTPMSPNTK